MDEDSRIEGNLRTLPETQPLYFLPRENLSEEVLIPSFRVSDNACCMIGFFSSASLATLAPGLATFINSTDSNLKLVVSPFLSEEDMAAIEQGVISPEEVSVNIFDEILVTEELLQQHTLKCLSYLIRKGRIQIKIALLKNALFHPKIWIFDRSGDILAAHGSSNMTFSGIRRNFEQITISKSWVDSTQKYIVDKIKCQFDLLWEEKEDGCLVVPMPLAINERIVREYSSDRPPKESEYLKLYQKAKKLDCELNETQEPFLTPEFNFKIPSWVNYRTGPFKHQGEAVDSWRRSNFRGILEMATGSGKTMTALIGAYQAYKANKPMLIVVAAPYLPLINQWLDEISVFNLNPINLSSVSGYSEKAKLVEQLKRRIRTRVSTIEILIVSHDTLCTKDFSNLISKFDCARLLIADEAHNLGRKGFINHLPDYYEMRLALSATPVRQYDQEGTDALFQFFGSVVFSFPLEQAIGNCLVEYDYYVHPCYLNAIEMDEWYELTIKIKKNIWRLKQGTPDDYLANLYRNRRRLIETVESKLKTLSTLLDNEKVNDLKYTLIYASDKEPEQLLSVNQLLKNRGILFHQLTADETKNRLRTKEIINSFQNAEIQVLTAKRVLDEGVNIPQICKAYILASTTVERQWVQRRGRLLRTCSTVDKKFSIIHDFIALPTANLTELDPDTKAMLRSELSRVQSFALLAKNAGKEGGPLSLIDDLVSAIYG